MSLGKTFTSVAAAVICKLITEKVIMALPLPILTGNNLDKWVNMALTYFPCIISEQREWYTLQGQHSVPHRPIEIQPTPLQGHSALTSALEPRLVVTMPGVTEMLKSVIDEITYGTNVKLIYSLLSEHAGLTHRNPNTTIDEPESRWNIHLGSYDT